MRYQLKEKVLLEVLKEAVIQLNYSVGDIDNMTRNSLMREAHLVISIANKTGNAIIGNDVFGIGTYAETVSCFWSTFDAKTATKLVEELELAVDALECQYE